MRYNMIAYVYVNLWCRRCDLLIRGRQSRDLQRPIWKYANGVRRPYLWFPQAKRSRNDLEMKSKVLFINPHAVGILIDKGRNLDNLKFSSF